MDKIFLGALLCLVIGVGFVVWALFDPCWKTDDSYEALVPFIVGICLIVVAVIVAVITCLIWPFRGV